MHGSRAVHHIRSLGALVAISLALSGCSSTGGNRPAQRAARALWNGTWSVVEAPLIVGGSPWNLTWDLIVTGGDVEDGSTAALWKGYLEDGGGPGLVLLTLFGTILQPLGSFVAVLGGSHPG